MSDYRELINEAIKLGRTKLNEEEDVVLDEPVVDDTAESGGTNVISISRDISDAFDNFLDLLASSISDLEDSVGTDPDGADYIMNLTLKGQKMETGFSRLKEVLLRAPDSLGGDQAEQAEPQEPVVAPEPEPETQMKSGFGGADEAEPVEA